MKVIENSAKTFITMGKLIPLFLAIPLAKSLDAGIPSSREVWNVVPKLNKRGATYMVNVNEAKNN